MQISSIASTTNPVIKEAVRTRDRHQQFKNEAFFIEGPHLLETALQTDGAVLKQVFSTETFLSRPDGREVINAAVRRIGDRKRVFQVTDPVMEKLCDTGTPQGVAAIVAMPAVSLPELTLHDAPLLVACDRIQDPGNIGTIVRLADAVNADAVILLPDCANPFSPKAVRSSAGSIFHVPVVSADAGMLAGFARDKGFALLAADAHAPRTCFSTDLRRPAVVVFGSEAHGVSTVIRGRATDLIGIPMPGRAESLNVAMSAAVILYEALRQRGGIV